MQENTPTIEHKERFAVLDVLRTAAILLVLARHGLRPFWQNPDEPFLPVGPLDLGAPLLNGWIGVDLFFVLSGFLIAQQLLPVFDSARNRKSGTLKYFKKRFFRIAPAYYFVLTLVCLGVFAGYPSFNPESAFGWRYVYHLLFLNDYFPSDILVVFWSLAIEMKFYLLAPLLLWLLRNENAMTKCAALGALVIAVILVRLVTDQTGLVTSYESYFVHLRNKFHLSLDGLLGGMICAVLWRDAGIRNFLKGRNVSAALLAAGFFIFLTLVFPAPLVDVDISFFDKIFLPTVLALGFSFIMLGALGRWSTWENGWSFTRYIALISYSLYLVHMLFLAPALVIGEMMFHPVTLTGAWLATLGPWLILSVAAASALYYFVEKPFNKWARKQR